MVADGITTVDYHTAGEPFRIVTGGVPGLRGGTMLERRRDARDRLDHVRRLLVHEPRGHADMYGGFVTPPAVPGSDLGVVFFHNEGYSTACGHGTIALATYALEHGLVPPVEPVTRMAIDVPSGTLAVEADVREGRVGEVRFRNVPAFVHARGLSVPTGRGVLAVDVAFGGAFYASVPAAAAGLAVEPGALPALVALGREVKAGVEREHAVVHPEEAELRGVYGVIFHEPAGDARTQRNVTVFADGEVDRSPCGSGTSARLALLDADGGLPRGAVLRHLGIVGTAFRARVVGTATVAGTPAVVTEVGGRASLTGYHRFLLRPDDEVGEGFLLR